MSKSKPGGPNSQVIDVPEARADTIAPFCTPALRSVYHIHPRRRRLKSRRYFHRTCTSLINGPPICTRLITDPYGIRHGQPRSSRPYFTPWSPVAARYHLAGGRRPLTRRQYTTFRAQNGNWVRWVWGTELPLSMSFHCRSRNGSFYASTLPLDMEPLA